MIARTLKTDIISCKLGSLVSYKILNHDLIIQLRLQILFDNKVVVDCYIPIIN